MPTLAFWLASSVLAAGPVATPGWPKAVDPRLTIELFAADPDIVTPIGVAVEPGGRVLVVESHTHHRPKGYSGPPADRIRALEDTDGDGRADRITTVFEGGTATMGLALRHDGVLFVAKRDELFRLSRQRDGTYGERQTIARLETAADYEHNGLAGVALDWAGGVTFGLGENRGASYKLVGRDGTVLTGGGEGGNIYRCEPDGTGLVRVATGFWNPFHLAYDTFGRLFAVDNDPDSRPPCRLLHIVEGGDYGYRYRNGRKGLHPFTAWNGELPGTLPMVAGTGEAPSGLVAYESDDLPADYRGELLVTSWGDHGIDRFRLEPRGASFRSEPRAVITGGEHFRPVGLAQAPDGSLYVSDWVDKSYTLHGKGRIRRVRAVHPPRRSVPSDDRQALGHPDRATRESAARRLAGAGAPGVATLERAAGDHPDARARALALMALSSIHRATIGAISDRSAEVRALAVRLLPSPPVAAEAAAETDPAASVRAGALRRLAGPAARALLLRALIDVDPFLAQAAREGLKRSASLADLRELARSPIAERRLGALLILRDSTDPDARGVLPDLLADPDPAVRRAAIQWVGEGGLVEFRPRLEAELGSAAGTRETFEAALAALERIAGILRLPKEEVSGQDYVADLLLNARAAPAARRRALRILRPDHPALTLARYRGFLHSDDPGLALEAVRSLRETPYQERFDVLAGLARDGSRPAALRAEAVAGLSGDEPAWRELLVSLADQDDPALRRAALRSLRGAALSAAQRERLSGLAQQGKADAELVASVLNPGPAADTTPDRGLDGWIEALRGPADPAEGQRVFFHPKGPGCYRCHAVEGRGGVAGPELSAAGRALRRDRLVESIVNPSKEVAPLFVAWTVARTDGTVFDGLLVNETAEGVQTYVNRQGEVVTLPKSAVEERRPSPTSIMPDGLARSMTLPEFRDLIAYLRQPE